MPEKRGLGWYVDYCLLAAVALPCIAVDKIYLFLFPDEISRYR